MIDESTEALSPVDLEQQDLNSDAPNESAPAATEANLFSNTQVSKIVKREQQKAYERGKREALMELQQQQAMNSQQPIQSTPVASSPSSLGGIPQLSEDDIRRMIAQEAPQALQQQVQQYKIQQTVDSFVNKMKAAEERYPGMEERLSELDYTNLAPIVEMANNMENTADIMHELLENPMKMGNLVSLLYTQPKLAQKAIYDLSNSIKLNQDAISQAASAKEPLSQLKPSVNAGIDNGKMTVSDFRKIFR